MNPTWCPTTIDEPDTVLDHRRSLPRGFQTNPYDLMIRDEFTPKADGLTN